MNKTEIVNQMSKIGFKIKKHSPELLAVAGVVGTVASTVLACKATTKASDILNDTEEKIGEVHRILESDNIGSDQYSEKDGKKDLTLIYVQTGVKFAKLYAPAIGLGVLSLGCLLTSNNILRKRNIALAGAYAALDKGFKEYRGRVVEKFGEEIDRELKYNIKAKQITETEIDEETGKKKKVKKTLNVVDDSLGNSEYACFFDEYNPNWEKDADINFMFLKSQQQYANDLLIAKGHLFLNEVYDMIGQPRTKAGQIVGWVYDPESDDHDSYVSFGICDIHRENVRDFINGYEPSILLDFNVDGPILEMI
jgi:hypothetical protein